MNNVKHQLVVTRHIAATPDKVWQVMTEQLSSWWCPKPWTTEVVELDWRTGGRSAMVMRGPNGEEHASEGVFLEVTFGKRFVTTDALTVDHQPADPFMIGIWEITPENGGTRYTASARHWTDEARNQHEEMGFTEGWSKCAQQLAEICEGEK